MVDLKIPLKPIKKLLLYSLFSFFFSISFSQQIAIYDFENLNIGDITNQDGWVFSTSMSSFNNGYNCPVIGTVTVKAVAQDGSNVFGEKEVTITETVGIEEIHSLASNVFPNPTNGIIQIESTKEIKTISILSLRGKLVKKESLSNKVDISNLKNGIYIIELLNTDSSKEHHQIIKN